MTPRCEHVAGTERQIERATVSKRVGAVEGKQTFVELPVSTIPVIVIHLLTGSFFFAESLTPSQVALKRPAGRKPFGRINLHRMVRRIGEITGHARVQILRIRHDVVFRQTSIAQKYTCVAVVRRRVDIVGKLTGAVVRKECPSSGARAQSCACADSSAVDDTRPEVLASKYLVEQRRLTTGLYSFKRFQ